jgi:hypothetical protein
VKYQKQGIWLRPPKLRIDFFLDRDDSEDEIVGTEEALIVEESNTPALATNQSHLSKIFSEEEEEETYENIVQMQETFLDPNARVISVSQNTSRKIGTFNSFDTNSYI